MCGGEGVSKGEEGRRGGGVCAQHPARLIDSGRAHRFREDNVFIADSCYGVRAIVLVRHRDVRFASRNCKPLMTVSNN